MSDHHGREEGDPGQEQAGHQRVVRPEPLRERRRACRPRPLAAQVFDVRGVRRRPTSRGR
jgi:hypothetical protein